MFNPRYRLGTEPEKNSDDAATEAAKKKKEAEIQETDSPNKKRKTTASASSASGSADAAAVGTEPGAPAVNLQQLLEDARKKAAAPASED